MNDFDQEKIDRLMDEPNPNLSLYEKVLLEKARRARWRDDQTIQKFDWFLRSEMGDFFNYKPWEDDGI
jgi:hypothetical protein